jgi:hypothetical protein
MRVAKLGNRFVQLEGAHEHPLNLRAPVPRMSLALAA